MAILSSKRSDLGSEDTDAKSRLPDMPRTILLILVKIM